MWWPRNGCDGRLIAKILIMTIQVNLCCPLQDSAPNSPELWLLKLLPFLGHHPGFNIFFHNGLLGGPTLFLASWAVFGLDFSSFCDYMLHSWHIAINGCYLSSFFSLWQICAVLYMCITHTFIQKFLHILYMSMTAGYLKVSMQLNTCSSFQYKDTSAINHLPS